MPGVKLDWLLSERWVLRGVGHVGWGTEVSGDEHAWIWDVGLKSRYGLEHGDLDWGVLGEVFHAGYNPDNKRAGGLGGFGVAADFRYPIGWRTMDDGPMDIVWDVAYRWYGDELTFRSRSGPDVRIDDEWRFSVALARRDRRMKFWFLSFDQLGIGYRLSSDGDFRGITLNASGPLER
jgi:hypothetical protein